MVTSFNMTLVNKRWLYSCDIWYNHNDNDDVLAYFEAVFVLLGKEDEMDFISNVS